MSNGNADSRGFGRFAPSPTSELHVGNIRTALLAWLWARLSERQFVIRVEDLDQQRVAAAGHIAQGQVNELAEFGVTSDVGIVKQSDRMEYYRSFSDRIETYECFCSRKDIAAASQAPAGGIRRYPGTCSRLTDRERMLRKRQRPPAIRARTHSAEVTVTDVHAGTMTEQVDDLVLYRADGTPSYNLAVVVDDGLQEITQVVRGADLWSSTPRQAWLADAFGFNRPEWVHVGLVLNAENIPLSKRDASLTASQLRSSGVSTADIVTRLVASAGLPAAADVVSLTARMTIEMLNNPSMWQPWTTHGISDFIVDD